MGCEDVFKNKVQHAQLCRHIENKHLRCLHFRKHKLNERLWTLERHIFIMIKIKQNFYISTFIYLIFQRHIIFVHLLNNHQPLFSLVSWLIYFIPLPFCLKHVQWWLKPVGNNIFLYISLLCLYINAYAVYVLAYNVATISNLIF